jgi:hypothetical protein
MSNAVENRQASGMTKTNEKLSLENLNDMITKLTMIKAMPEKTKIYMETLKLNLDPALKRCERFNGKGIGTELWSTMAVKSCLRGYDR